MLQAQSDVCYIIIDIIGIATAGMANVYKTEAQGAAAYKGIMDGYEWKTSMSYDKYNYYSQIQSAASFVVQALDTWLNS